MLLGSIAILTFIKQILFLLSVAVTDRRSFLTVLSRGCLLFVLEASLYPVTINWPCYGYWKKEYVVNKHDEYRRVEACYRDDG